MTRAGVFGKFNTETFSVVKVVRGGFNQTTGQREATTRTTASIKGSLDPMTEADLKTYGIAQVKEGTFKFHTEGSHGLKQDDLITQASTNRTFRIVQILTTGPWVRHLMKADADPISYQVELTKEGRP